MRKRSEYENLWMYIRDTRCLTVYLVYVLDKPEIVIYNYALEIIQEKLFLM